MTIKRFLPDFFAGGKLGETENGQGSECEFPLSFFLSFFHSLLEEPFSNSRIWWQFKYRKCQEDLYGKRLLDSKPCYSATFSHTNPLSISKI